MQVNNYFDLNDYINTDAKLLSTYRLVPIRYLDKVRAIFKSKGIKGKDFEVRFRGKRQDKWAYSTIKANAHSFDVYCKGVKEYEYNGNTHYARVNMNYFKDLINV